MGKKDETEKLPFGAKKLRKTETVKREIKEAKMETVQLKHHEFEVTPRDADSEQTTGIILHEPLVSLDEGGADKKGEKKRKIKKQKKRDTEPKEPVVADEVVPSDDINTEDESKEPAVAEVIDDNVPSDDVKKEDEPELPDKVDEPSPLAKETKDVPDM